jgi:hypothetical protein
MDILERSRHGMEIGTAAEYYVCHDLLMNGHKAFLSAAGSRYDVVLDSNDRLYRIQVRATLKPRPINVARNKDGKGPPSYMFFGMRCGGIRNPMLLSTEHVDIMAFTALDIKTVAYIPLFQINKSTIHFRVPGYSMTHGNKRRKNMDQYPIEDALVEFDSARI